MIGHIFRKDLRRLWPFIVGIALGNFAIAIMRAASGPFPDDQSVLIRALSIVDPVTSLLVFFTIVMVVQLDPLPDDRQDWLARPIRRWDLLLAKLLFVTVCIHGPMLAGHLFQGFADGFAPGQAVAAALSWNVYEFVTFSLPVLAIAVLTRTIGQTLGLGVALFAGAFVVVGGTAWALYELQIADPAWEAGLTLIHWIVKNTFILTGTAAVLGVQYFRRDTLRAGAVLAVTFVLVFASQLLLPQTTGLAIQNWWLSDPGRNVSVSFAPDAAKLHVSAASGEFASRLVQQNTTPVYLPLHVTGIIPDLMLTGDNITATLTAADGEKQEIQLAFNIPLHVPGQSDAAMPLYQVMWVPNDFYRAHADQPVRVDINLLLGILRPHASYELPTIGGSFRTPEGAWCATKLINYDRGVQLGCLQIGNVHMRVSAVLIDHASGLRNPSMIRVLTSEAPYSNGGADVIARFYMNLPFRDPNTGVPYPVGARQLPTSAVLLTVSQPLTHIMRRVTIPDVRLNAWNADIKGAAP